MLNRDVFDKKLKLKMTSIQSKLFINESNNLSSLELKKINPLQKKKEQQFGDLSTDITCFIVSTKKKTQPVEDSN